MRVKMGSACCVAARDRTMTNGSGVDAMPRNIRYSPSWSFRWDNRRRVAGEETSISWSFDGVSTNDRLDYKSQTTIGTAYASEEGSPGSPLESFRNLTWQKSSSSEGYTVPHSDQPVSKNSSEVKGTRKAQLATESSPTKTSPSTRSLSSSSASPFSSSQGHHLLRQVSDSRIPDTKSPNFSFSESSGSPFTLPGWSNESNRGSFDSDSLNFNRNKITKKCGVCCKLLTEKSSWGSQKIIATNELDVVAILTCGHVYHAECLENMTSEINKFDPECPVCTYGEKQALKLPEKAMKTDIDLKAKINRKSRRRVAGDDFNDDVSRIARSSSCVKTAVGNGNGKPFLKRHFSFGSNGSRSYSENSFSWKRGYFWAKSSK